MRRVIGVVVALITVAALWRLGPLWTGPAIPPHATHLHIETDGLHLLPILACPGALLGPVRVTTDDDNLIVVVPDSGELVEVVWPTGWAAWRLSGRAELVDRGGGVVAREGDVVENRFGGGTYADEAFHVCQFGW